MAKRMAAILMMVLVTLYFQEGVCMKDGGVYGEEKKETGIIIDGTKLAFSQADGMGIPFIDSAGRVQVPEKRLLRKSERWKRHQAYCRESAYESESKNQDEPLPPSAVSGSSVTPVGRFDLPRARYKDEERPEVIVNHGYIYYLGDRGVTGTGQQE